MMSYCKGKVSEFLDWTRLPSSGCPIIQKKLINRSEKPKKVQGRCSKVGIQGDRAIGDPTTINLKKQKCPMLKIVPVLINCYTFIF